MNAALGALVLLAVTQGAEAEMYRCHQPDGTISFRQEPCPLAEMSAPEAAARAPAVRVPITAQSASAAPSAGAAPSPKPVERPVSVPSTARLKAVSLPRPTRGTTVAPDSSTAGPADDGLSVAADVAPQAPADIHAASAVEAIPERDAPAGDPAPVVEAALEVPADPEPPE
jgi:hypothetical protein